MLKSTINSRETLTSKKTGIENWNWNKKNLEFGRLEYSSLPVREAHAIPSGAQIEGLPEIPRKHIVIMFRGFSGQTLIGPS